MKYYAVERTGPYLTHHGILGQKWGIRRFQNKDGSLTSAGMKRYGVGDGNEDPDAYKNVTKVPAGAKIKLMRLARKGKYAKYFLERIQDSYVKTAPGEDVRLDEYKKFLANPKLYKSPEDRLPDEYNTTQRVLKTYHADKHINHMIDMLEKGSNWYDVDEYAKVAAIDEYKKAGKAGAESIRKWERASLVYKPGRSWEDMATISGLYMDHAEAKYHGYDIWGGYRPDKPEPGVWPWR